ARVPADFAHAGQRARDGVARVRLIVAPAEMEACAAHTDGIELRHLSFGKVVAHNADGAEALANLGRERRKFVEQQAMIAVVALRVDDHAALDAQNPQPVANYGDGYARHDER